MHNPSPSRVKESAAARFWRSFCDYLQKHYLFAHYPTGQRQRIEADIDLHEGRRLAIHDAADVIGYLNEPGRYPKLEAWRVQQSADALCVLFCGMLQMDGRHCLV